MLRSPGIACLLQKASSRCPCPGRDTGVRAGYTARGPRVSPVVANTARPPRSNDNLAIMSENIKNGLIDSWGADHGIRHHWAADPRSFAVVPRSPGGLHGVVRQSSGCRTGDGEASPVPGAISLGRAEQQHVHKLPHTWAGDWVRPVRGCGV